MEHGATLSDFALSGLQSEAFVCLITEKNNDFNLKVQSCNSALNALPYCQCEISDRRRRSSASVDHTCNVSIPSLAMLVKLLRALQVQPDGCTRRRLTYPELAKRQAEEPVVGEDVDGADGHDDEPDDEVSQRQAHDVHVANLQRPSQQAHESSTLPSIEDLESSGRLH